jgi:hypothetical protein
MYLLLFLRSLFVELLFVSDNPTSQVHVDLTAIEAQVILGIICVGGIIICGLHTIQQIIMAGKGVLEALGVRHKSLKRKPQKAPGGYSHPRVENHGGTNDGPDP